jgi:hypothetical protein
VRESEKGEESQKKEREAQASQEQKVREKDRML